MEGNDNRAIIWDDDDEVVEGVVEDVEGVVEDVEGNVEDVVIEDVADSYIFIDKIDKINNKSSESSWSEYIRKTYNTTSIFLGIAVIYLYFLYKKPSKSASNL
jgi:hypothetical protein